MNISFFNISNANDINKIMEFLLLIIVQYDKNNRGRFWILETSKFLRYKTSDILRINRLYKYQNKLLNFKSV
jgi:hypothetical protein